jgi:hypothetical protein
MTELDQLRLMRRNLRRIEDPQAEDAARAALGRAVRSETHSKHRNPFRRRPYLVSAVAAGAAGVLAAVVLTLPTSETPPARDLSALAGVAGGGEANYLTADTPAELADQLQSGASVSHLVAQGQISEFAEGRTYGSGPERIPTIVMTVEVEDVLQGTLPKGSDGKIYVEFEGGLPEDTDELVARLREANLVGTPALLYLSELGPEGRYPGLKVDIVDPDPAEGQPLYGVFTTGLFLEDSAADRVIEPQESLVYEDASLEDFGPTKDDFPPATFEPGTGQEVAR